MPFLDTFSDKFDASVPPNIKLLFLPSYNIEIDAWLRKVVNQLVAQCLIFALRGRVAVVCMYR